MAIPSRYSCLDYPHRCRRPDGVAHHRLVWSGKFDENPKVRFEACTFSRPLGLDNQELVLESDFLKRPFADAASPKRSLRTKNQIGLVKGDPVLNDELSDDGDATEKGAGERQFSRDQSLIEAT